MRFTEIELQSEDVLWFAIDNQNHIIAFTSGGAELTLMLLILR